METRQLTTVGGLLQESLASPMHGFDVLGSDSIDSLPTPDPLRYGFFSFIAQVDNPTVSFNTGTQSNTIYWPDGTTTGVSASNSKTLTGITAGDALTVQLAEPLKFGLSNITATGGLGNCEVFWEGITSTTNVDLSNLGLTRPILNSMTNTMTNFDLRGNNVGGDFPDGITVTNNLYIQDNRFTGSLPTFSNGMIRYQVNGNEFRGDIPDISNSTSIRSFLCYDQNDGVLKRRPNIRTMLTGTIPDLSGCTNLTFYHVGAGPSWVNGFKNDFSVASDFDVAVKLEKFFASNCQLSTADVDKILAAFAAKAGTFTNPTTIDLSGTNGFPTATGLADKQTLEANGWAVKLPAQT
jgi:hypothetical protein